MQGFRPSAIEGSGDLFAHTDFFIIPTHVKEQTCFSTSTTVPGYRYYHTGVHFFWGSTSCSPSAPASTESLEFWMAGSPTLPHLDCWRHCAQFLKYVFCRVM